MTRDEIVAEVRTWIGTPWHHQGRLKGVGVDCIGVVVGVARALGVPVRDQVDYGLTPNDRRLESALAEHCALCTEPGPGDLVLLRFLGEPQHTGIDCGDTFVHGWQSAGKVIEQHWTDKWRARIVARYVFPGVSD